MIGFIPNLHIILLGDEFRAGEFLPYGKQLIRQLLAQGRFSNKRSVSPADGVLVEAWTSGEHRWVRITAVGCPSIFMDSGLAGLHNIGLQNPALTGQDGTLHYGTTIKAYLGQKKLLGKISPPGIACTPSIELDATKAYAAETKIVDGKEVRDSGSEGMLAVKKSYTARMPSSLFTGKLRLWVQAQYGKPLAEWNLEPNWRNQPPSWDLMTKASGVDRLFQIHSSHTGIFTDSKKRHWLVQLGVKGAYADGNKVNLFLMRTSPCIEKLRANLLDSSPLTIEEKERVEAYILAYSVPDYDTCVSLDCSVPLNSNMGYGWHFSWSGGQTDIIGIAMRDLGGGVYDYKSTHYRIKITRNDEYVDDATNTTLQNESRRWKAVLETVEESGYWRNAKWQHVIANPEWSEGTLSIFGSILGGNYGAGAPMYCFYTRASDTVPTIVRYTGTGGDALVERMTASSTPEFGTSIDWTTGSYGGIYYYVHGYDGGNYIYRQRVNKPASTSFSAVGPDETATVSVSTQSYTEWNYTVSGVSLQEPVWYGWDLYVNWYRSTMYINATYSASSTSITHSEEAKTLCVIPFGDAEAIYLWGQHHAWGVGTSASDSFTGSIQSVRWEETAQNVFPGVPDLGTIARTETLWDEMRANTPSTPADNPGFDTYSTVGSKMVSNAGVSDFNPSGLVVSAFFAGEPNTSVMQTFWTNTSAGFEPAVNGSGAPLTGGYITGGVFMGWA